ncbi:TIP41-domain-containing protein [Neocallimastix sp. 'constans']|jgi:type 2A phosphatase activator TIP41
MDATVISNSNSTPKYRTFEHKDTCEKGIEIKDWRVTTRKDRIYNSEEIDSILNETKMPQVPEMYFGFNHITIENTKTNVKWSYNTNDAFRKVQINLKENENWIKVAVADKWNASRNSKEEEEKKKIHRPYDWTFSTDFRGKIENTEAEITKEKIDMTKLMRRDPILFFDQVILYEDELADNGIATLDVKVRVMPTGIFVLGRYFLRIENVLFRSNETRVYVEFNKGYMLSEYFSRELPYEDIKNALPKPKLWESEERQKLKEVKMFADSNWVSSMLTNKDHPSIMKVSDKIIDQTIELETGPNNNKILDSEKLNLPRSKFGNGNIGYIVFEKIQ